jgi:hypothetical protein
MNVLRGACSMRKLKASKVFLPSPRWGEGGRATAARNTTALECYFPARTVSKSLYAASRLSGGKS